MKKFDIEELVFAAVGIVMIVGAVCLIALTIKFIFLAA